MTRMILTHQYDPRFGWLKHPLNLTQNRFRIVTALAPPFVMEGALDEDGQCLRGVICHRVLNSDKDNLTLVFNEMETQERQEEEEEELGRYFLRLYLDELYKYLFLNLLLLQI